MSAAAQQRPQEPSMEEILASIRKIIADDTGDAKAAAAPVPMVPPAQPAAPRIAPAQPAPAPVPAKAAADEDDDILELKPSARRNQTHYLADDPVPQDLHFVDPEPAPPPPPPVVVLPEPPVVVAPPVLPLPPPPVVDPPPAPDRLISDVAEAAVSHSFGNLASTILASNARTLEDLVREMLKPMIRTWLDDNLPTMVERLVRAEIERVARGGRS